MHRKVVWALWIGGALIGLSSARPAAAFCPTRTCQPKIESCDVIGAERCVVSGRELFRSAGCVTFSVQEAGSARHGLPADELERLIAEAFERWLSVDCGDGSRPSIEAQSLGALACHEVQYNCTYGNANIFMFHDDAWTIPGAAAAYALTTVSYVKSSGEIRDADVEINGTVEDLAWSAAEDGIDLGSILTHEVGHFLGLAHSTGDTVMRERYSPKIDNLRQLTDDDIAGICSIYPPERATSGDCAPRNGFASDCGPGDGDSCLIVTGGSGCCSTAPGRSGPEAAAALTLCALLSLGRRRASRPPRSERNHDE